MSLAGFLLAPFQAAAQDLCFPTPAALPGLSGPPDWKAPGTLRSELNEPRWAASPQTTFESDITASQGLFRVMVDAAYSELSVSFQAPTDPNIVSSSDAIYFGFTTDGTTAAAAKGVRINPPNSGSGLIDIDPTGPLVQGYVYAAASWSTPGGAPTWLKEPAAWRGDPTAAWGINFKIDLAAAGLAVGVPFKITLGLHKRDEADTTPPFDAVSIITPNPGANPLLTGTLFVQNPVNWKNAAAINAACPGGITLSMNQIGTRNPVASEINIKDGATNRFFAAPTFPSPPGFAGLIEGKFHIANWGSIAASNAPWVVIPNGSAVQNGVSPAPNDETLEFDCPVNAGGQTCGLPTPSEHHQCMYVELKAAPGQTVQFTKATAYRNMEFKSLSKHTAPAEISVKGLKAVFGNDEPRDVYLYVHARNMPSHQEKPLWLQTEKMAATRRFAEVPPPARPRPRRQEGAAAVAAAQKLRELPLPNTGIADLALNAHQALSAVWPTYDVHVFYDTGKIIPIDKVDTKLLAPMYPFTYFFSHEGPLYGFSHALEGIEGAEVKELRPNVYLIKIPSEGTAKIATHAEAHEEAKAGPAPQPSGCPECPKVNPTCGCSVPGAGGSQAAWGLAALAALGLVLVRRRRQRG